MKLRKRRKMAKRLEERKSANPIPSHAPRGAFKVPGSQNPHKGRWGSGAMK